MCSGSYLGSGNPSWPPRTLTLSADPPGSHSPSLGYPLRWQRWRCTRHPAMSAELAHSNASYEALCQWGNSHSLRTCYIAISVQHYIPWWCWVWNSDPVLGWFCYWSTLWSQGRNTPATHVPGHPQCTPQSSSLLLSPRSLGGWDQRTCVRSGQKVTTQSGFIMSM